MEGTVLSYDEGLHVGIIVSGHDQYTLHLTDFCVGKLFTLFPLKLDRVMFDVDPADTHRRPRALNVRRVRDLRQ
jgi:hypothetical protein